MTPMIMRGGSAPDTRALAAARAVCTTLTTIAVPAAATQRAVTIAGLIFGVTGCGFDFWGYGVKH
tara:strand:- start:19793 stop:19987 length:195 start_codon:yes stop_codon:yes gene_type:complete